MAKVDTPQTPGPMEDERGRTGPQGGARPQAAPPRPLMTSFLEHLVRNKIITEDVAIQASEWKKNNERDRRSLVEILKEEFGLSQDVLHYQVAQFYAFRIIDINERGARRLVPADVLKILRGLPEHTRQLAMRHKVLPYDIAENQPDKIIVVTPNPADREISDVARALPYKKFEICYMKERDWAEYWRQLTVEKDQPGSTALSMVDIAAEETEADFEDIVEKEISRGQLLPLIENILSDAVRVGATDIHINPRHQRKTEISFRIDGQLALWYAIDDTRAEAVIAALKTRIPSMDRFERMAAQEGSLQKVIDNQVVRFSVSVLPVLSRDLGGKFESVVIRVQRNADQEGVESIVTEPSTLRVVKDAIGRPGGLFLLAALEGNGGGGTLTAALRTAMRPGASVVTVEDPAETYVEGIRQIKINPKLSLADATHAVLNHDADIVAFGALEPAETAEIALRLAVAGRQTFGRVYSRDAVRALARLYTAGINPFFIAEGVGVVLAQRQVRKLCERCKEPVTKISREMVLRVGFTEEEASSTTFYRAVGCINCTAGFKGRTPVHEAIEMTPEMRDALLHWGDGVTTAEIERLALSQGMVGFKAATLGVLRRGSTTLAEAIAALT
jgi:type IV pilus assembly protein PilB